MRFILIDRITVLEAGKHAEGTKRFGPDEDFFRDHFPGYPIVPGVLLTECLAQLGGRLVEWSVRQASGRRVLPVLGKIEQAKFFHSVHPGDTVDLSVDVAAIADDVARVTGVARVGGRKAAVAGIMYPILDVDAASDRLSAAETAALHEWSDRIWKELWKDERRDQ
jgi:3-hydroxyacyl-[acyl-carrier-protein] dehydratase